MSIPNNYNLKNFYNSIITTQPLRYGHQFVVEFNGADLAAFTSPSFNNVSEPNKNFTYYVRSTSIPKTSIGSAKVSYFAAGFEVPGVINYPDSWEVTFLLDQNLTQYDILRNWQEQLSSYQKSGGGIKTIPNIYGKVGLLDRTMKNIIKTYVMEGTWIQDLSQVDFQYQEGASEVKTCTGTFIFQYFYDLEEEGDPLAAVPQQ